MFAHLGHTTKGLCVVHEGSIESFGQGCISDVCREYKCTEPCGRYEVWEIMVRGWHTVVCGAYSTGRNHKIVLLCHASARLDSAMLLLLQSRSAAVSADVHFVLLVRYNLNTLPAMPCHAIQYQKRGNNAISHTIQCHSGSNSAQSNLSYGPAFSRLESRHFLRVKNRRGGREGRW